MEACGINFFYLRAVFPLTLMLATASAQVCVPLGHSSLYFIKCTEDGCSRLEARPQTAKTVALPLMPQKQLCRI